MKQICNYIVYIYPICTKDQTSKTGLSCYSDKTLDAHINITGYVVEKKTLKIKSKSYQIIKGNNKTNYY